MEADVRPKTFYIAKHWLSMRIFRGRWVEFHPGSNLNIGAKCCSRESSALVEQLRRDYDQPLAGAEYAGDRPDPAFGQGPEVANGEVDRRGMFCRRQQGDDGECCGAVD